MYSRWLTFLLGSCTWYPYSQLFNAWVRGISATHKRPWCRWVTQKLSSVYHGGVCFASVSGLFSVEVLNCFSSQIVSNLWQFFYSLLSVSRLFYLAVGHTIKYLLIISPRHIYLFILFFFNPQILFPISAVDFCLRYFLDDIPGSKRRCSMFDEVCLAVSPFRVLCCIWESPNTCQQDTPYRDGIQLGSRKNRCL